MMRVAGSVVSTELGGVLASAAGSVVLPGAAPATAEAAGACQAC